MPVDEAVESRDGTGAVPYDWCNHGTAQGPSPTIVPRIAGFLLDYATSRCYDYPRNLARIGWTESKMAKRKRRKHIPAHAPSASAPTIGNQEQKHTDGVLQIRLYGDPVLRQKASPIGAITSAEKKLADSMLTTLYAIPNGVGLAAPQVGVLKRLVVIDVHREDLDSKPLVLINPEIQSLEGEVVDEEACLSIPDITADVKRAEKVHVSALNVDGEQFSIEGEGFFARVLQHEIDHLDGVMFIDHVGGLKRQLLRKKLRRIQGQSTDE